MASVEIFWNFGLGFDVHVLAGETSPSLLDLLVIKEDNKALHVASASLPADVKRAGIVFTPRFLSLVTPPESGGITVDTTTGAVTAAKTLPARPRLERFVIEATVTTTSTPPVVLGPIPIRVHVHASIKAIWLTPSTLTVRRRTTGVRFTVLAQFDNDTVGDISPRAGIDWTESDPSTPSSPHVRVVRGTGALIAEEDAGTVTITAKHAGRTASATAEAAPPWSEPVEAKLLHSRSAGISKMAGVPNVLFLSDGFNVFDLRAYEKLVRLVVDQLQRAGSPLRPFDLFKGKINYWAAFLPSREHGASTLYDMQVGPGAKPSGFEIDLPVKREPGVPLTLANLIYEVGLPAPDDAQPGKTIQAKRMEWLISYGPRVSLDFPDAVITAWQQLHTHRLANERDTAFGISFGQRPTTHSPRPHREPGLHPLRATEQDLDELLKTIFCQTANGTPAIGAIWADPKGGAPPPAHPDLPTGLTTGRDRGLVVLILGGARMGGVQTGPAIALSLGNDGRVPLSLVSGTRQVAVEPHPQPATPPPDGLATVAHEIAHALSLRDEYGERGGRLTIPAIEEKDMAEIGNVQPASVLVTSPADQRLDPAKLHAIKWMWPRIAAAGVLKHPPAPGAAGAFQIELEPGHAADFRDRDIVRLRKRPLVSSPTPSPRLRVTGKPNLATDTVTVKPLDPAAGIAPGDWPAGSVLIRPVRGPKTAQDPNGPDLPLVAPLIVDHLRVTRIPLNRTPAATGKPAPVCVRDDRDEQPPRNLPTGLKRPKFKRIVAGLYDGGFTYHCGVLHPTGACLMRALTHTVPKQGPVPYAFCHVCRYVLVDRLDPPLHRVIEADVVKHKQYPSK